MTRARAFGLDLDARFELQGFGGSGRPEGTRPVRLELTIDSALRALAGAGEAERIAQVQGPGGRPVASIDRVASAGYLARAEGFGGAWIDTGGGAVRCAPADLPPWRWQRFLVGQVLPFAAVLNGLEAFHASAVVIERRAVALVAASGVGKTSLALELALRGLGFLNDDVLVVEPADAGLLAHPGAPLANVRRDGGALAQRMCEANLGHVLGVTGDETRIALRSHSDAVPLGAIFFLRRVGAGNRPLVERVSPVEPRLLLAATFNLALRDGARLARQLEVCGLAAESAALFRVECPLAVAAPELAQEIHDAAVAVAGSWS